MASRSDIVRADRASAGMAAADSATGVSGVAGSPGQPDPGGTGESKSSPVSGCGSVTYWLYRLSVGSAKIRDVSTIVFFHAHPDDESSQTAGSMAKASDQGHRVVVVYATGGEHGEVPDDLAEGETLAMRRRSEAEQSARFTGTSRVEWLGYHDSGMTGWEQNADPQSFHQASVEEAAGRLARILDDEDADVLIGYDWHGGYGHPDHVKVHAVTYAAASLAARSPRVLEETMNRDVMRESIQAARDAGMEIPFDPDDPMDDGNPMGTPEAELHWAVDVSEHLDRIRSAMQSHRSQVSDIGSFMAMPPEVFAGSFGTEYFIERGRPVGMRHGWFLDEPVTGAEEVAG
jgi:LmbE family N-acetylglucosaminyl deacetylase